MWINCYWLKWWSSDWWIRIFCALKELKSEVKRIPIVWRSCDQKKKTNTPLSVIYWCGYIPSLSIYHSLAIIMARGGGSSSRPSSTYQQQRHQQILRQPSIKPRDADSCCSVKFVKNVLHVFNIIFFVSAVLIYGGTCSYWKLSGIMLWRLASFAVRVWKLHHQCRYDDSQRSIAYCIDDGSCIVRWWWGWVRWEGQLMDIKF